MRIKHNLTLGGVIMLVVLAGIVAAGYIWYSHARSVRVREERAAKVSASEAKILIYEDEIKKLSENKNPLETELAVLDAKIKDAAKKADASAAKLKEWSGHLDDFRKKMDEARRTVDQQNRDLALKSRNNRPTQSPEAAQIAAAERNLSTLQKELEKVNCHYNCMGRSKPNSKTRPSDDGIWVFDQNNKPLYWKCKKHGYTFTDSIGYLDYKNESSRLNLESGKCQRQIAELKAQAVNQPTNQQTTATAQFDSVAWNAKLDEAKAVVEKIRDEANRDRKTLDTLNSEKLDLESRVKDIERKIEDNESRIKNERLSIADNQK